MKKRLVSMLMAICLLLSGCGYMDGSYVSVTPHREQRQVQQQDAVTVSDYKTLLEALKQIVASRQESAVLYVPDYPADRLRTGIDLALHNMKYSDPLGNYALEDIHCELGASGSIPALAVTATYRRSQAELRQIKKAATMEDGEKLVENALERFEAGLVMQIEDYRQEDFIQFCQDFGTANPQLVMEAPQVTETVYGNGRGRVVELVFTYQNSRDDLRKMKAQVKPVFDSAVLYVSGDGAQRQKFSQLYAFLMERFDYKIETSLTPSYSLLRHGVGDSRAFATVFSAMCRDAELECMTVTGTCAGEPRTWNIVREGDWYYHVDLLQCSVLGGYHTYTDQQMEGYVWDYSAYPACDGPAYESLEPVEEPEA